MEQKSSVEVFASMPVKKLVLKNANSSIVAMLMVLIYNLADTFLSVRQMMPCRLRQYPWQHRFFYCLWP